MTLFKRETRTAMLKNDSVLDATFFRFCAEVPASYTKEPRVHIIVGYQFMPSGWPLHGGARYSDARLPPVWSGAWRHYDPQFADRPTGRVGRMLGDEE